MKPKPLRVLYTLEFLVALMAIFTAWSEIGGQSTLDVMHWSWKLGLSLGLAASFIGYTAAIASLESVWTMRSARWLTAIVVFILAMGVVTWFYSAQVDNGDSDDPGTISFLVMPPPACAT